MNRKIIVFFEIFILLFAALSFSYLLRVEDERIFKDYYKWEGFDFFKKVIGFYKENLKYGILSYASAQEVSSDWRERLRQGIFESDVSSSSDSSLLGDVGCCSLTNQGYRCAASPARDCMANSSFVQGVPCSRVSFCKKGCCYDDSSGIYERNVLKVDCPAKWVDDPNCNLPGARLGCCILGQTTAYVTQGQCQVMTYKRALGRNESMDWRAGLDELSCVMLAKNQKEGACVLPGGNCEFAKEGDCLANGGNFSEGFLCTSRALNTTCKMTNETTCVEGRDGVYFKDSCGNIANIYDSSRASDPSYWDRVIKPQNSCNPSSGNANSKSCGNCNLVLGGICSSAIGSSVKPDIGNYYCKNTSCVYEGKTYLNGESWCVYDGKIGDGDDVVGSRHFKYVCNQGQIKVEPCADYRQQICIQSNNYEINGTSVDFRTATCIANNWRECITLNKDEDGLKKCEEAVNCMVQKVRIADKFRFDVCVPKYPAGFDLRDPRYQEVASSICGMASQTCMVIRKPKTTGGCKIVKNKGCLSERFAQEMNDFCTSLGDCGMKVNIVGDYNEKNYRVSKSPKLSSSWIQKLVSYAKPVPGQYAKVENYSKYLDAAGFGQLPSEMEEEEGGEDGKSGGGLITMTHAMGLAGIGYAIGVMVTKSLTLKGLSMLAFEKAAGTMALTKTGSLAGFAGASIGAAIGMIAGMYLAKVLKLSPLGSTLMAVGSAMVGANVAINVMTGQSIFSLGVLGFIGLGLMIAAVFFGAAKCKPIKVEFKCNNWQPPVGGAKCEECNKDPLKPCSVYRCQSLGSACELINRGTENEMCINFRRNDSSPPRVGPPLPVGPIGFEVIEKEKNRFVIKPKGGECFDAYSYISFSIVTDEPSICKFDIEPKDFDEMEYSFGGNYYKINHTAVFTLPDPSHGESQGERFSADFKFYIKCQDVMGITTPNFYIVEMCVNQGKDVTPPRIIAVEPENNKLISFNSTRQRVFVYTNEISTCRWSFSDVRYDSMTNDMECEDWRDHFGYNEEEVGEEEIDDNFNYSILGPEDSPRSVAGYTCVANLPINSSVNTYYFRCKDQPWLIGKENESERAESSSFRYTLRKPSEIISIDSISPSRDLEVATDYVTINLEVRTKGGSDNHRCFFSFSGYDRMIEFFNTGVGRVHTQELNRPATSQNIFIECVDETGDKARGMASFNIIRKSSVPLVSRVWRDSSQINFITSEDSECRFNLDGCYFNFSSGQDAGRGTLHRISSVRGNTYYIKCKDLLGNIPSDCSIIVRSV